MQCIVEATQKAAFNSENRYLVDCLSQVSPSSYLKLMARWHFNEIYAPAFAAALCYFSAKVDILYMAFRIRFICKDDNNVFFDIGVSLDEGCTEYITQEIIKHADEKCVEDAYYFEVEFYKNIVKQFGIGKQEEGKIMFTNRGPLFLYEHTKDMNDCLFYNFFKLSDDKNWRGAYQILRKIKEATNYGVD